MSRKTILFGGVACIVAAGAVLFSVFYDGKNGSSDNAAISVGKQPKPYVPPVPPVVLSDPGERADYLARHFWDRFPMADTAYIGAAEITEQALANYLYILNEASPAAAGEGLGILLEKAAEGNTRMFAHFAELLEHYLYDPNSPARNDERYIAVLRHIADSPHVGDIYKIRPKSQLEMALKNRPGDRAADFGYALANGTHGSLYAVRAEYTLLVFYDPDCPGCREVTARMATSRLLRSWTTDRRKLSVLAVYPGEDTVLWSRRKKELPDDWIVCRDSSRQLLPDRLYDLRAFPTIYLLDKAKRVVLKDATFEAVEKWLEQHIALLIHQK
ncbi:MAG: DUF5106 domain-containing protein [Rikenellaceae bacterium]|nr:DUF5106 domain-containing protein [Rikenellaceae bacterium]